MSSIDKKEKYLMHSKSDSIEIGINRDEFTEELLQSLLNMNYIKS